MYRGQTTVTEQYGLLGQYAKTRTPTGTKLRLCIEVQKMKPGLQDENSSLQLNKAWPFKAVAERSNGILCCTNKGTQSRKSKSF